MANAFAQRQKSAIERVGAVDQKLPDATRPSAEDAFVSMLADSADEFCAFQSELEGLDESEVLEAHKRRHRASLAAAAAYLMSEAGLSSTMPSADDSASGDFLAMSSGNASFAFGGSSSGDASFAFGGSSSGDDSPSGMAVAEHFSIQELRAIMGCGYEKARLYLNKMEEAGYATRVGRKVLTTRERLAAFQRDVPDVTLFYRH